MKHLILLFFVCLQFNVLSQEALFYEKPPVFSSCDSVGVNDLQKCFNSAVYNHIHDTFKIPEIVKKEEYSGHVYILFEVDVKGQFKVVYVDAIYEELKKEVQRVFDKLPIIRPATYNGRPVFKQYSIRFNVPFEEVVVERTEESKVKNVSTIETRVKKEFDSVNTTLINYENQAYSSQLNIPFTHADYSKFDRQINLVGTNSHTASKPFVYQDVSKYYDFNEEQAKLKQDRATWAGRKLWNEHLVQLQGKDYWFTIDPIFDLEVGHDSEADFSSTYNNTRGLRVQGGLGEKFNFYTTVFESQGRFAQYFNQYAESLKAFGPDPAVIPGRGIAKRFKTDSYDYPVAEAYLSYAPVHFINIQFGHGKNFIGDGYRSLLLSDVASPHPFLKINTQFWKIKYTNTWMWLKDVRPEVTEDGAFLTKYIANHYLSWNVSKRLNLGFFESVMWTNTNNRGFDINYLNPVIFYRAIEFETGQDAGNAILGASAKYKINDHINIYSQFVLDEFSLKEIKGGERSWANKYGYQIGAKYYNAFNVDNLLLQAEYNRIRPYTYSHNTIATNYGHSNQSMAHLWGANLSEFIVIGRYHYNRWFANAKFIFGVRGLDFNDGIDNFSYGSDVYRDYDDRPFDTGVEVGQGNKTNVFNGNLQAGYLINPASNLKIFTEVTFRDFNPETETASTFKSNTVWINFGIRTDLFNWYFDF
ncbi:energy transducer TonB [Aestuariibaculum sediminum]|uniref:Gliding motility protein RemB n=1 Tax=Aestuariibaculum sediminum TaxID=2770637 RepID=A0A8J6UHW7_9FLAO|nr:gliding motility protein RemB [Aestuariibaculum sediminum]MBD0833476.1 gliding motility protein RemB [Aestuariibaculum sediminum]